MMVHNDVDSRAQSRLGTVLRGKYHLESVIGLGGMAVVYKATHRNQAEYAIKMLHPELSYNSDLRTRFLREGYAANSVKHAGVVRVVDDDVSEDGAAFLVMELLDGVVCESLPSQHGGRLPLDAACFIALDLLDVLAAAHAKAIIHRDIKPANLFITRDGCLKVLDFGIARVRDTMAGGVHATGTGILLGTPAFMAPEQAIGKTSDIDARVDLWAAGATVFMLATGAMVHEAETAPQLLVKLATQPPRSLATVLPDAPSSIVRVIDRALAFDKAERWSTASAMRDALAFACRASFPQSTPRAVLASLVREAPAGPVSALGATEHGAEISLSAGEAPRPGALSAASSPAAPSSAGHVPAPVAPGIVVETSRPVSTSPIPMKRRSPRGVVVGVVALATASTVGVAAALRARHPPLEPAVTSVRSTGSGESQGAAATTNAAATASIAIYAHPESSDAAPRDAVAPSASAPAPYKSETPTGPGRAAASTRSMMPPLAAASSASHLAQKLPGAKPEAPPPATQLPGPRLGSPSAPSVDPLDGRR